jgi:hypothetical protein
MGPPGREPGSLLCADIRTAQGASIVRRHGWPKVIAGDGVRATIIMDIDRESETRALHPFGYAAISLPQAPSVHLPPLGRIHRFADRRWPGLAPDDHRAKKR